MEVLLQRHCARYIYVIPEGLRELMSDISREVLRNQPEDTYTFVADYLDALMITRENARVAARLVQSITEITTTTVEFLQQTGMDRSEADYVVSIIQKAFKRHIQIQPGELPLEAQTEEVEEANIISDIINEANISPEKGEEAAIIIQRAFRAFKLRKEKERELLSGMIDWRAAARSAIHLYRHTGVTNEEANRAATLIKAAYKGYYTRRLMKKLVEESRRLEEGFPEEELESSEGRSTDKLVKINYETVIPHVDFDESKVATETSSVTRTQASSSASAVVASAIEGILEAAFLQTEEKEIKLTQFEPPAMPPDFEAGMPAEEVPEEVKEPLEEVGEQIEAPEVQATTEEAPEGAPDAPVEEHPEEQAAEAAADQPAEAPAEVPAEAPAEAPPEAPAEAPAEAPVEPAEEPPPEQAEEAPAENA